MAIVTLRAYLDELTTMFNQQALEEVIAHCRYILQTFPKNVAVYRLLGQTLLRRDDQQEALDVFQRVLSAVPDDALVHRSLAALYREQDALPQAIWHLERAFEIDPNDSATREALRTAYQRQTGAIPDRLVLTRGGLAYLHFRGQLYDQAIVELQGLLSAEPDRVDLRLLLTRTLWAYQRPTIAGDLALRVLEVLPDSIDANEIMARLWLQYKRPSDARPFLDRLQALDPFRALRLVRPDDPNADQSIELPHLNYGSYDNTAMLSETPDWMHGVGGDYQTEGGYANSDPFGLGVASSPERDWKAGFAAPNEEAASTIDWFAQPDLTVAPQADSDYGYGSQSNASSTANFAPSEQPFARQVQDFEPPVPDWFTQLDLPANSTAAPSPASPAPTEEFGVPDYLQNFGGEPASPASSALPAMNVAPFAEADSLDSDESLPPWLRDAPTVRPSAARPIGRLAAAPPEPATPPSQSLAAEDWNAPYLDTVPTAAPSAPTGDDPFATIWGAPEQSADQVNTADTAANWLADQSPADRGTSVPPAPESPSEAMPDWFTDLPDATAPGVSSAEAAASMPNWDDDRSTAEPVDVATAPPANADMNADQNVNTDQNADDVMPDWLNRLDTSRNPSASSMDTLIYPPVARDPNDTQGKRRAFDGIETVPMAALPSESPAALNLDMPDWLSDLPDAAQAADTAPEAPSEFQSDAPESAAETAYDDAWLTDFSTVGDFADDRSVAAESAFNQSFGTDTEPGVDLSPEVDPEADPAWLHDLPLSETVPATPIVTSPIAPEVLPVPEARPDLDWLSALGEEAYPSQGVTSDTVEDAPEQWLPPVVPDQALPASGLSARMVSSTPQPKVEVSAMPASPAPVETTDADDWLGALRASANDEPTINEPLPASTFASLPEPTFAELSTPIPASPSPEMDFLDSISAADESAAADPLAQMGSLSDTLSTADGDAGDWLGGLNVAEPPAAEGDWLTQFGVVGEEVAAPSTPPTDTAPGSDDPMLPDWLKTPATETVEAPNADQNAPRRPGMTGYLNAANQIPREPVLSPAVEPLTDAPDWMAAFTGDALPPANEPIADFEPASRVPDSGRSTRLPDIPAWMQEPDFSQRAQTPQGGQTTMLPPPPTAASPASSTAQPPLNPARGQSNPAEGLPLPGFDQAITDAGTDWLTAFNPLAFESDQPTKSAFEFKKPPAWRRKANPPGTDTASADNTQQNPLGKDPPPAR